MPASASVASRAMPRGPYRTSAPACAPDRPVDAAVDDPGMTGAVVVMLVASVLRIIPLCAGQEPFGLEPLLAVASVVCCGWWGIRTVTDRLRRR